jgi:hypothetical protein
VKQEAENLRAQLKEEKAKHKQAQQALVREQQYFMDKLADMEAVTKGAPFLDDSSSACVLCKMHPLQRLWLVFIVQ